MPVSDTPADERTTQIGLLAETAIAHQRFIEEALGRLQAHTQSLDAIVRDEIRRTLVDEFLGLEEQSRRAVYALQGVQRAASIRLGLWSLSVIVLSTGIALAWVFLKTRPEDSNLAALRALESRGGRLDLRQCGERVCVRIDPRLPAFGPQQEYRVIGLP